MTLDEMLATYAQQNGMPGGDVMSDAPPIAGDQFAEARKKAPAQKAAPAAPGVVVPEIEISPLATPEEASELKRLNREIVQHRAAIAKISGPDSEYTSTNSK